LLLFGSKVMAGVLAVTLPVIAAAIALATTWKLRDFRSELLAYSVVAVLTLLCAYHRFYDAVFLILPLAWAFGEFRTTLRHQAIASVVLIMVFLIPGASLLFSLVKWGWVPASISQAWWWQALVMPHQVYTITAVAFCLLWALIRRRAADDGAAMVSADILSDTTGPSA